MYLQVQALVLRVTDYNDRDALLTLLTRRHGKLTVKARGLRRKNSPLIAPCQLLAFSEFTLFEYRGMYTINEAASIELFRGLQRDLTKLSLGSYFAQAAEVLSQEDLPNPELLSLLLNSLHVLCAGTVPEAQVKAVFELRSACIAGYTPDLSGCCQCGREEADRFDILAGRLECADHRSPDGGHSGGHALYLLLRPQAALFLYPGRGFPGCPGWHHGKLPDHPAGTGLFCIGFL